MNRREEMSAMKRYSVPLWATITGLVVTSGGLNAQLTEVPLDSAVIIAPVSSPASSQKPSSEPLASIPSPDCPPTCKVCVTEPKHNTKKVYAVKCEEYCLPRCSLLSLLRGKCACDDGCCGVVKVRHRLIIKKVDDCDTKECVLREVPACPPIKDAPKALGGDKAISGKKP